MKKKKLKPLPTLDKLEDGECDDWKEDCRRRNCKITEPSEEVKKLLMKK